MSYTRFHIESNRVRLVQNRKSICAIIGFTFFNFKEKKGQTLFDKQLHLFVANAQLGCLKFLASGF